MQAITYNEFKQYCLKRSLNVPVDYNSFQNVLLYCIRDMLNGCNNNSSNRTKRRVIVEVLNDFQELGVNIKQELDIKEIVY